MNKKKLLVIALALCLIGTLSFTTLAWFTDSDEATNEFTIGSIEVVQHEKIDPNDDGILEDFVDGKVMMPVVNMDDPAVDANYQDKIVYIENTGNNPAYIRTWIAIPKALENILHLDYSTGTAWSAVAKSDTEVVYEGVTYVVYSSIWPTALEKGKVTDNLLEGVYLDAAVDLNVYRNDAGQVTHAYFVWNGTEITGFNAAQKVNVLVLTQAVQAEGFGNAQSALESAFGNNVPNFAAAN